MRGPGEESEERGEKDEEHAEPLGGGDGFAGPKESEKGGDDGGEVLEEGEAGEGEVTLGFVPSEEGQGGGAKGQYGDKEPGRGVGGEGQRAAEEEGGGDNPESAEENGPGREGEGADAPDEGAAKDGVEGPAEAGEQDEEVAEPQDAEAESGGGEDSEDEQDAEEAEDDGGEPAGGERVAEGEANQHDEKGNPSLEEGGVDDRHGALGAEEKPCHEGGTDEPPKGQRGPIAEARREGAASAAEEGEGEKEGGGKEVAGGGDGFGGEGAGRHEDASDGKHGAPAEDGKKCPGKADENGRAGGHGAPFFAHAKRFVKKERQGEAWNHASAPLWLVAAPLGVQSHEHRGQNSIRGQERKIGDCGRGGVGVK